MIRGKYLDKTEKELNSFTDPKELARWMETGKGSFPNEETEYFRRECIEEGFCLTHIYPIYYQGWELDKWGAIGTKDGKTYRLETGHGSLKSKEINSLPSLEEMQVLVFGDE